MPAAKLRSLIVATRPPPSNRNLNPSGPGGAGCKGPPTGTLLTERETVVAAHQAEPDASQKLNFIEAFLSNLDENFASFDFHRIRFHIYADWRALGLAGREIEPAVMLGALNPVFHHQTAGEMYPGMRAMAVRGIKLAFGGPINSKSPVAMIESPHVF
jgi:hypothetical protein